MKPTVLNMCTVLGHAFAQGSVVQQGKVLMQDKVQVSESVTAPRFRERRLFLFERILIVAEEITSAKKSVVPTSTYIFKNSIGVTSLHHEHRVPASAITTTLPDGVLPRLFTIDDRAKPEVRFLVDPMSDEAKATWLEKFRSLHQAQNDFLKGTASGYVTSKRYFQHARTTSHYITSEHYITSKQYTVHTYL